MLEGKDFQDSFLAGYNNKSVALPHSNWESVIMFFPRWFDYPDMYTTIAEKL